MTLDELCALPPPIALRILLNALPEAHEYISRVEAPKIPRAPKYDETIWRRGGITWASEYDAEGLRYWHARAVESAAGGGEYADKDAKRAKALSYWIGWREVFPTAVWSGLRFGQPATAAAPSGKPEVYPREGGQRRQEPAPKPFGGGEDEGDLFGGGDDDISF